MVRQCEFSELGNAEESLMRFDSYDIAGELLDTVCP